ncbi:MAG: serine hydrolase [Anaerolineae bacterium]|nr:serine hydrolase [Anaerolineae bacterium]
MRKYIFYLLALVVLLFVPVVNGQDDMMWPTEAWATSTPEAQGMDSQAIAGYLSFLDEPGINIDSLMIVRHGQVVAEAYYAPATSDTKFSLYGGATSVTSALVGIALEQGYIESVDKPVLSFFPDRTVANLDDQKAAMTLRDLLTMGSGFDCDVSMGTDTVEAMKASEDWVQFALDAPMASMPGSQWGYCNTNFFLVSAILEAATGQSMLELAQANLFKPLGISDVSWAVTPTGGNTGDAGLQLTLRDWARFGYLYLHGGEWDGAQVVPADWVTDSVTSQIATPFGVGYGYGWWIFEGMGAMALGAGGQYLFVMPGLDLVLAATGSATEATRTDHQLPALLGGLMSMPYADEPLADNAEGVAQLAATIETLANPAPTVVPSMPDMAAQISGKVYGLFNPGLFRLDFFVEYVIPGLDTSGWDTQAFSLDFSDDEATLSLVFADGEQQAVPVGLDGIYRISEGRLGTIGAKGEWLTGNLFRAYLKNIGGGITYRLDMTFTGAVVEIIDFEINGGTVKSIFGVVSE